MRAVAIRYCCPPDKRGEQKNEGSGDGQGSPYLSLPTHVSPHTLPSTPRVGDLSLLGQALAQIRQYSGGTPVVLSLTQEHDPHAFLDLNLQQRRDKICVGKKVGGKGSVPLACTRVHTWAGTFSSHLGRCIVILLRFG